MMTKNEALKMAIEALEMHVPYYVKDRGCEAIQACKEALEQPAQEPIHNCPNCNSLFTTEIHSIPAPSWQGMQLASDVDIAKSIMEKNNE